MGISTKAGGSVVARLKPRNLMDMSNSKTKRLSSPIATEIATAILTVYTNTEPTECTRAAMMFEGPDGTERDMGGRCKTSIESTIDSVLRSHGFKV